MKNPLMKLSFLCFWLCLTQSLSSQGLVNFFVGSASGSCGETICLPITVQGFTNINSVNASVNWNSNELRYIEMRNVELPGFFPASNANETLVENGAIGFSWLDLTAVSPHTISLNGVLMEVCYEIIAPISDSNTKVSLSNFPTVFSVSQAPADPTLPSIELDHNEEEGNISIIQGCNPDALVCNSGITALVSINTCSVEIQPQLLLASGPSNYDNIVISPNCFDFNYIGQTVQVTATNTVTGNSCWGLVNIASLQGTCELADQIAYDQVNIILENETSKEVTPEMVLFPHQDPDRFTIDPSQVSTTTLGQVPFAVTSVDDDMDFGNLYVCEKKPRIATCKKIIETIQPNGLAQVTLDQACATMADQCTDKGWIYSFSNEVNNVSSFFVDCDDADNPGGITEEGYSIYLWTGNILLDSCHNFLQVLDGAQHCQNIAGPLTCNSVVFVSTDPWACQASLTPDMILEGSVPQGSFTVEPSIITELNTPTEVRVTNTNTNESCWGTVTLQDKTPPVIVTKQQSNALLDLSAGNSTIRVYAEDIDNGSYDACFEVGFEPEFWDFDCDDIGVNVVTFGVWDDADGDGVPGSTNQDNLNEVFITIRVESNISSDLECPDEVVITCSDDLSDPFVTGWPTNSFGCTNAISYRDTRGYDANSDGDIEDTYVAINGAIVQEEYNAACGQGLILRTFTLGSSSCEQLIAVTPGLAFDPAMITWPSDVTVGCLADATENPTWEYDGCELIGYTLQADTFLMSGGTCLQLVKNFSVINWCEYDPNDPDLPGKYSRSIVITLDNNEVPELSVPSDFTFNCIGGNLSFGATADDNCAGGDQLRWVVTLDINSDSNFDYEWSSFVAADPVGTVWQDNDGNGIPDVRVGAGHAFDNLTKPYTVSGEEYVVSLPNFPSSPTPHTITWKVFDVCGNSTSGSSLFTIDNSASQDAVAPTPFCLNLGSVVMQDGYVEVFALDFDQGSFDNCSERSNLTFTFTDVAPPSRCDEYYNSTGTNDWYDGEFWFFDSSEAITDSDNCNLDNQGAYSDGGYNSNTGNFENYRDDIHGYYDSYNSSVRRLTSEDIEPSGFITLDVYVWDEAGNKNSCSVNLRVIITEPDCTDTEEDIKWPNADLLVSTDQPGPNISPNNLVSEFGFTNPQVRPTIACDHYISDFHDTPLSAGEESKILREWTVLNWETEVVYSFIQIITIRSNQVYICDFLPNTAPLGDCASGHTDTDDVEWPADIVISDHRISPTELVAFSNVADKDAAPQFFNEPSAYLYTYADFFIDINAQFLFLDREWTVIRPSLPGAEWTYRQKITIDLTNFNGLVSVNTINNRPMPKVRITDQVETNSVGIGIVDENDSITPNYTDTAINGVNIRDLVLIHQHIIGPEKLNTKQLIAADVNADSSVSGIDLVELKKLILGIYQDFPAKQIWNFIERPLGVNEISVRGNYLGVKTGDVDDTAVLENDMIDYETISIVYEDVVFNRGQSYEVPIYYNSSERTANGLEFSFDIDESLVHIDDISSSLLDGPIDYHINQGMLKILYLSELESLNPADILCTITVTALENSTLSNSLSFSEELPSFVLDSENVLFEIEAELDGELTNGTHNVEGYSVSVYPNPVSDILYLDIPTEIKASDYELSIFDITGREMLTSKANTRINLSRLSTGVYTYRLQLGQKYYSDKLIIEK